MGFSVFEQASSVSKPNKQLRLLRLMAGRLRRRLASRPDTEHETTINRVGLNIFAFIYLAVYITYFAPSSPEPGMGTSTLTIGYAACISLLYFVSATSLFAHMVWKPASNPARRVFAMALDFSFITYVMHLGGVQFSWCYPFLLWTIFGNGFRYGTRYLFIATAMAVCAFSLLMTFNPFWQRYPALSWGCLIGLVVLPAYVSVLIRKLSEAIEAAEEANRAKSLFLASVSHELRTPLNAVIGLSDLLNATRLNGEQSDMSRTIGEAGRSLLSLINSVLDLSRLEVGKMPLLDEKLDLFALLNRIRNITSVAANAKNVRVSLQIAPEVPQYVMASSRLLEEIVTNLASNAVKFTHDGYVLLRVRSEPITSGKIALTIEAKDTGIGIAKEAQDSIFERFMQADESIVDRFGGTGLGLAIAKQMVEQRGGSITVDSEVGVGSTFTVHITLDIADDDSAKPVLDRKIIALTQDSELADTLRQINPALEIATGPNQVATLMSSEKDAGNNKPILVYDLSCPGDLPAIAKMLSTADRHGNYTKTIAINKIQDLELDDELAQQFVSIVEAPVTIQAIENAIRIALPANHAGIEGTAADIFHAATCGHILVADDNKTNQKVIGKILERAGHTVTFADNGQVALETLQHDQFDIAFMDINMPELNGLEATKLYKFARAGADEVPIYALTADVTETMRIKCKDAGMAGCLSKPIEPAKLLAVIDEQITTAGGAVMQAAEMQPQENSEHAEIDAEEDIEKGPIDTAALNDLADLGGPDFVREVVNQFLDDSVSVLEGLSAAVETQNYHAFRDDLHALRSGAANVGARNVFQSCLKWRDIEPGELAVSGTEHLQTLQQQFEEARSQLMQHIQREIELQENRHDSGDKNTAEAG